MGEYMGKQLLKVFGESSPMKYIVNLALVVALAKASSSPTGDDIVENLLHSLTNEQVSYLQHHAENDHAAAIANDDARFPLKILVTDAPVKEMHGCYERTDSPDFEFTDPSQLLWSVPGKYIYKNKSGYEFRHMFRMYGQGGAGWYWVSVKEGADHVSAQKAGVGEYFPAEALSMGDLGVLIYKVSPYSFLRWDLAHAPPTDGWRFQFYEYLAKPCELRVWQPNSDAEITAVQAEIPAPDTLANVIMEFSGHLWAPTPKQRTYNEKPAEAGASSQSEQDDCALM